ncbi:MAG: iron-containing redox enzyme family protein, partial [Alphaproteobacteria bacterium]
MTFYDRLLAETADARSDFISLPLIGRALNGDVPRDLYLDYLAQAYHHVRHTCPLLAFAASRTQDSRYQ